MKVLTKVKMYGLEKCLLNRYAVEFTASTKTKIAFVPFKKFPTLSSID